MAKIFLLTLVVVVAAIALLSVRILFKRGGSFHSQHIGQSKAMRDRGIHCAPSTDKLEYNSRINVEDMEK